MKYCSDESLNHSLGLKVKLLVFFTAFLRKHTWFWVKLFKGHKHFFLINLNKSSFAGEKSNICIQETKASRRTFLTCPPDLLLLPRACLAEIYPATCVSRSTGAAVIDSPPQASSSASSSANDVSSMSTETTDPSSDPAVTSETDSSLDSHTSLGALACCR